MLLTTTGEREGQDEAGRRSSGIDVYLVVAAGSHVHITIGVEGRPKQRVILLLENSRRAGDGDGRCLFLLASRLCRRNEVDQCMSNVMRKKRRRRKGNRGRAG